MARNLEPILDALRSMLPELGRKHGVSKLWVFGSMARKEGSSASDLDLLVEFQRERFSLLDFVRLELEIEDRLGVKVDLVERQALRRDFQAAVFREAIAV